MTDLILDLRYAWRRLAAAPSFAIIAISTLAVGIGVTTAVYSLVYAMMFRPMNIPNIDRVVNVNHSGGTSVPLIALSWPDYQDFKASQTVFDTTAGWTRIRAPLRGPQRTEMLMGEAVEGTYFGLLGVPAALGRTITPLDDSPAAAPVTVLSHQLWRGRFAADPQIVGRVITLHGQQVEVIGVAPSWFRGVDMPNVAPTELWVPLAHKAAFQGWGGELHDRWSRWVRVKGRLAEGRTLEEARTEVNRIGHQLDQAFPSETRSRRRAREGWRAVPAASVHMNEGIDRIGLPISYGLMAALALVLLIACVNIANLLLARAAGRRVEMATRIAIGASRARLLRQLLTENALLCTIGGALGLLIAFMLTRFMTMEFNVGRGFDFAFAPRIEWPVLLVALGGTGLAGLAFGLVPALQGARTDVRSAMSGTVTGRRRLVSGRRMLVIFQLGLSVAFLVVGSVFLRGLAAYAAHDPGFDVSRTAIAGFELDFRWKDDHVSAARFLARLRERAGQQPGVTAAAVINAFPVGGGYLPFVYPRDEQSDAPPGDPRLRVSARMLIASPEALEVLGIPLTRGRFFTSEDTPASPRVAVLSEAAARRVFGTDDVVGRRLRFLRQATLGQEKPEPISVEVVGVARDTDVGSIGERDWGILFVPFGQAHEREMGVAVRTAADPAGAAAALSVLVEQLDDQIVAYADTGENILSNEVVPTRVGAAVAGGLGGLAFLLAIVGLYGVMSHLVAMRTREIGIRMALGAEAARVVRLILREGAGVVVAGACLGALLAYWILAVLGRLIFGIEGQEPMVLAGVTVALGLVALIACWIPARRAARVDPNVALRHL